MLRREKGLVFIDLWRGAGSYGLPQILRQPVVANDQVFVIRQGGREPVERQTAFAGRLRGLDGEDVLFERQGGKLVRLPMRLISRARLEVEF